MVREAGPSEEDPAAASIRCRARSWARGVVMTATLPCACRGPCGWELQVIPRSHVGVVEVSIAQAASGRAGRFATVAIDNAAIPALIADLLIASGRTPDLPTHPEENHVDDHARHG